MDKMQGDINAIQAALSRGATREAKTESGFTQSQEARIIQGHNRAATLIQVAAIVAGFVAVYLWGFQYLIFAVFVAWLFNQARLK